MPCNHAACLHRQATLENWEPVKDLQHCGCPGDGSFGTKTLGVQSDSSFSNLVVSPGSASLYTTVSLASRGGICSVIGEDLSRES